MIEPVIYVTEDGKAPFGDWFDDLDVMAALKVRTTLARIETGNLGDVMPVGQGVSERRIPFGPGYSVYFDQDGDKLVILLCGGTKKRQSKDMHKLRCRGTTTRHGRRKEADMALTRDFKDTIKAQAERHPAFRRGLFQKAIEAFLSDDTETGKLLLRDYVNTTVGFEKLETEPDKSPKSLNQWAEEVLDRAAGYPPNQVTRPRHRMIRLPAQRAACHFVATCRRGRTLLKSNTKLSKI